MDDAEKIDTLKEAVAKLVSELRAGRSRDIEIAAANAEIARLREANEWRPIESAPRDGTVVDLWIVGYDDTVNFYTLYATKAPGRRARHGRATNFVWGQKPPYAANWYPLGGLAGYPLSPEVTATHWRPLPTPPKEKGE